jgi:hypothetical protein
MSVSQDLLSAQSSFVDRRREQRFPLDLIPAQVQSDEDPTAIHARIVDISTSGLRLNLDSSSKVGSVMTVWFNDTIASGETRYCLPRQDGSFDVGLRLLDVFDRG